MPDVFVITSNAGHQHTSAPTESRFPFRTRTHCRPVDWRIIQIECEANVRRAKFTRSMVARVCPKTKLNLGLFVEPFDRLDCVRCAFFALVRTKPIQSTEAFRRFRSCFFSLFCGFTCHVTDQHQHRIDEPLDRAKKYAFLSR